MAIVKKTNPIPKTIVGDMLVMREDIDIKYAIDAPTPILETTNTITAMFILFPFVVQYMRDKAKLLPDYQVMPTSAHVLAFRQASKHNHRRQ